MGLFLPSQQPLRQSSKLPALRAVVFAKVRARHLGFLLLSRRSVQNLSILPVSACSRACRKRQVLPIPLHLLFRPNPLCWALVEFSVLPHSGAASGFGAFGGYAPGCVRKTGHSRDTRLTLVDRRFSAAPVGTLPTAFGCVPAHIPCPALQASAHKTAGWRTEWAEAYTEGFRSAYVHPA